MNRTPPTLSPMVPALESVLCTEELDHRPSRPPDYETENRALVLLAQALADSPGTILQTLADTILKVFHCDSGGVSLVTKDGKRFHWPAIAGAWKPHVGGGTPRDFGPCGDVLDRNCPLLFSHFERRYTYFQPVMPPAEECLLVPFYVEGKAVGTIWAITHDDRLGARKFDSEDRRMLVSLGTFASAAYQAVEHLHALSVQAHQREESQQATREMNEALLVSSVQQHELAELAQKDITERKQAEEALQDADRRKNEFLAMLAHELRNPLAPIRNALHLLRLHRQEESQDVCQAHDIIERQVENLVRLVDDLLDVSRITSGKIQLRKVRVDLAAVVARAVEGSRPLIDVRRHSLEVTLPHDTVPVDADPVRLAQVLWNLLNNAAKYTPEGGRITLHVERGEDAVVRIRDNGMGIAAEMLPKVFDLFTQMERTLDRAEGGLGIGLTLVRRLTEMHGGTVQAFSEGAGQGCEFVVRLPLLPNEEWSSVPAVPAREGGIAPPSGRRILVVDDNRDAAESLSKLLRLFGNDVRTAHDGRLALEVSAVYKPDVVLLDIGLPGLDGLEVCRRMRGQLAQVKTLLVAMTGYAGEEDRRRCEEAGFDAHLVKPLDLDTLQDLLSRPKVARHRAIRDQEASAP